MTDYDRGPYTPPSDRLAFDPREPVRGGGPAPVTLIISGVVLLALIGGAYWLYRGGVRHHGDAPASVGAPITQIKTPAVPANDTGPRLVVDRSDAAIPAANAAPTFAPPAEQPLPRPLPMAPQPVVSQSLSPPAAAPAAKPPPAPPVAVATAPTPPPPTVAPARPAPSIAAPARPSPSIASLTDAALAKRPAARPAPKPTPTAPTAALATTDAAPAAGAGWVQIGAYSSADLARQGWSDTARLKPSAMAGKGQRIEALERDGKTLYRAYVTGFSRDGAERFCAELKAAGKACFVK